MDELIQAAVAGGTAAFDADGTLWADDVGEAFLRALEADGTVPAGSWAEYERRLALDPSDAYGFAVTVMEGLRVGDVQERAAAFYGRFFEPRLFPETRSLLAALLDGGVRVAIVSASNLWLIEAAGRALGVRAATGVAVEVDRGRLTGRLVRPIPSGEGKPVWARELLGSPPALAVGNGENDLPLLRSASVAAVVCPAEAPDTPAARFAREQGWPVMPLEHPCPDAPLP